MNIPYLTIRPYTERPITVWEGSISCSRLKKAEDEIELNLKGKAPKILGWQVCRQGWKDNIE